MPDYPRYSRDALIARALAGERLKYVFFWGHRAREDGVTTKSCFSQWWPSPFTMDGVTYATAEHWMMAEKARLFGAGQIRARILAAPTPGAAKALGREIESFDAEQWGAEKYDIVVRGNVAKFGQTPSLKTFLINTGDRVLVEASPVDKIWGIGLDEKDPAASDPKQWKGENLLGFALMSARDLLSATP